MRIFIGDFVVMTLTFVVMMAVQDAWAKQTREEQRANRRATEIIYQSCVNACFEGCRK